MSLIKRFVAFIEHKSIILDIVFIIHSLLLFINSLNSGFISFIRKICATILAIAISLMMMIYILPFIASTHLLIMTPASFLSLLVFISTISFYILIRLLPLRRYKIFFIDLVYALCYTVILNFIFLGTVNIGLRYVYRNQDKALAGQIVAWNILPEHIKPNIDEAGQVKYSQTKSLFMISLILSDAVQDKIWHYIYRSNASITFRIQVACALVRYCSLLERRLPDHSRVMPSLAFIKYVMLISDERINSVKLDRLYKTLSNHNIDV